jgi:predicted lipoprotein with Yx(FWY)xxD motif
MDRRLAILCSVLALAAAACAGSDTATTSAAPAPTSTVSSTTPPPSTSSTVTTAGPETPDPTITVAVADSALGEILVDGDGNTLYLFTPDDSGPSVCNGDCAAAWPPVVGEANAGPGIDTTLLGNAIRDDGSSQATYNSWPLYYFAGDAAPGDTNGQGLNDVWFVITPAGEAMR